jgi:hypothetical protein
MMLKISDFFFKPKISEFRNLKRNALFVAFPDMALDR